MEWERFVEDRFERNRKETLVDINNAYMLLSILLPPALFYVCREMRFGRDRNASFTDIYAK